MVRLAIVPVTLDEANEFVRRHHRHHKPVPGAKFCVAVALDAGIGTDSLAICGVAIVGRPIARMLDDGWTLEVNRTCTDGTKNANSMLYGACRRVAFGLGYLKLILTTWEGEGEYCFKRQETIPFSTIPMQKQLLRERQTIQEAVARCKCQQPEGKK